MFSYVSSFNSKKEYGLSNWTKMDENDNLHLLMCDLEQDCLAFLNLYFLMHKIKITVSIS